MKINGGASAMLSAGLEWNYLVQGVMPFIYLAKISALFCETAAQEGV